MKAILIARVSTIEQKEAGNSLPAQQERLRRYCEQKGFKILRICSFDESAYTDERNEFDYIIDFILEQKEKIVVCCDKVDRLSRNVFDKRISVLYEKAINDKLELHFVSDGQVINSQISAVEKFQFSISLGLAKYYSDAISDNVKRSFEQKLRKGEWLSLAPYGYRHTTKPDGTKDIVMDEYESQVVRKIFELYATGAYSLDLLCKKINAEYGTKFIRGSMGKLLSNPFYYGIMVVKGKEYPHRYPCVISHVLFDRVKEVKDSFKKKPYKYAGKPYIYRGLLRCAHCGLAITPEQHKGYIYYHCTQYNGKHGAKWLREEEITRQLGEVFKNLKVPKNILEEISEMLETLHKDKMDFHDKQLDEIAREKKTLSKMVDNLYLDRLKGRITESEYDRYYESFKRQGEDLAIRLEKLEDAENNYYINAKYVFDLASRAHELFESSEVDQRRELIKLVLSNLRVEDEKVLYDAQKPFDLILNANACKQWRG